MQMKYSPFYVSLNRTGALKPKNKKCQPLGMTPARDAGKEPEDKELSCRKNLLLLLFPLLHFSLYSNLAEQEQPRPSSPCPAIAPGSNLRLALIPRFFAFFPGIALVSAQGQPCRQQSRCPRSAADAHRVRELPGRSRDHKWLL